MADIAMTAALAKALGGGGEVDPAVIEGAVNDWLDDHPEATTTVEDGSITKAKLDSNLQGTVDDVDELKNAIKLNGTITGEAGAYKYIRYDDGKEYAYANPSYIFTFDIGCLTKFKYRFTVTSAGLMGLAFYDNSDKFISNSGVQATTQAQVVTVPANAVKCKATVLSADDVTVVATIQDLLEDVAELDGEILTSVQTSYTGLTPTSGYYVDSRDGKVSANANMSYIQVPIKAGSAIQYNSVIPTPDIRGIAFYNAYGAFIAGYQMLATPQTITIPADATLCKATVNSANDIYLILKPADIASYADKKETFNILSAFENITCVGDSLTWSQVYLAGGGTRKAHRPWVETFEERTGATTEELAGPGYSASNWWSYLGGQIASKTNQLAVIYLGTNLGLSDTLDTDCVGDDPNEWGSTLTADYCRIINAFKAVGSQVILVKPFTTTGNTYAGTDYVSTTAAIDHIATRFGCGVVEPIYLADSAYHKYPDGAGENAVHYNDLGYAAFVDKLITGIAHMKNEFMVNIVPE